MIIFGPSEKSREERSDEICEKIFLANRRADDWEDLQKKSQMIEADLRERKAKPTFQKIQDDVQSGRMFIYQLISLGFIPIMVWEFIISKDIYQVLFPGAPFVPLVGLIFLGLFISLCLGEGTKEFSVFNRMKEAVRKSGPNILDSKSPKIKKRGLGNSWFIHPVTGVVLGSIFLLFILGASHFRMELLSQAGEGTSRWMEFLPVVLYGAEVLFGIPAIYVVYSLYVMWTLKKLGQRLAQASDVAKDSKEEAERLYNEYHFLVKVEREKGNYFPILEANQTLQRIISFPPEKNGFKGLRGAQVEQEMTK